MNIEEIQVKEAAGRRESLVLSLQAMARACGHAIDYDGLMAALGLNVLTVAAHADCLGRWCGFGRDAFLLESARLLGFTFRELHPPDAAVGLADSEEFPGHFADSYVPLIRRALENDQPVLAWMGWPDPPWGRWGVITQFDAATGRLYGSTAESGGGRLPLTGPSVQLYVLEDFQARTPDAETLRDVFSRHARAVLGNQLGNKLNVTTGPEAFDAWLDRLSCTPVCETCGAESWSCHLRHAGFIREARESAVRFAGAIDDATARRCAELAQQQCDLLAASCSAADVQKAFAKPKTQRSLAEKIRQVQSLEKELAALLRV